MKRFQLQQRYSKQLKNDHSIFLQKLIKQYISEEMIITKHLRRAFYFSVSKFDGNKNYYKILDLSQNATQKQIKKAFRNLAKKYHPDATSGNENKFKQINEAYQVLSSEETKRQYDQVRAGSQSQYGNRSQNSYSYGGQASNQYNPNYANTNGQNPFTQNYYEGYQKSRQKSNYRGYSKADGWQNDQYRQQILRQIFENQYARHQKNRSTYSNLNEMYRNHEEKIRQYNDQMKGYQQNIRRAYKQQEERRQRQYKQYQEKQINDIAQELKKKAAKMKEGLVKNVEGVVKVGQFLKGAWNSIKNMKDSSKDKK